MSSVKYVQYGCGLSAPKKWENYDASPTLRIQKLPVIGRMMKDKLNTHFPSGVRYGDIVKGLPIPDDSCKGVYCSHTLEHLSLADFRIALINTKRMLVSNGIFRCIVPDLERAARRYTKALDEGRDDASILFIKETMLGIENRRKGMKGILSSIYGNVHHLWMWDYRSLSKELEKIGFKDIRACKFNDCSDEMFQLVEDSGRFENAVAIECRK